MNVDLAVQRAPEPGPPARDDVLLGDVLIDAVHARPRQDPPREHVDQAAERDDAAGGR